MTEYTLHFDGSCGPKNPGGTAAYGFVLALRSSKDALDLGHGIIGSGEGMTNNLAEFWAVAQGLKAFLDLMRTEPALGGRKLRVYGDSKLVTQIMTGNWRASSDKAYWPGYETARSYLETIREAGVDVKFNWIPREQNTLCDDLSKVHQETSCL